PSVHFSGAVDALVDEETGERLLGALRGALAAAHRRSGVGAITVGVTAGDGGVRLRIEDDGTPPTVVTWPEGP
ncbi:histidine kinase, partial [Streptomyces sp. SID2131]|nr:histidine kinase [Streptomyces sp. SID2131]